MEYLIGFVINILDFFAYDNLMSALFKTNAKLKNKLCLFMAQFIFLNVICEKIMRNVSALKFILSFAVTYIIFYYLYRTSKTIVVFLIWKVVSASFEIFAIASFSNIFKVSLLEIMSDVLYFTVVAISYSLILYCISLWFKRWISLKLDIKNISRNEVLLLSIYPLVNYSIIYFVLYKEYLSGTISKPSWFISIALFIVTFLIFYFIGEISEGNKNKQIILIKEKEDEARKEYMKAVQIAYDNQRRLTHDYNREISTLQSILQLKDYTTLENYLNKISAKTQRNKIVVSTHNTLVDAILNQKYTEAKAMQVSMEFVLDDLSALQISEEDIVCILTNSLDNAIEAASKSDDKIIQVFMSFGEDELLCVIKNSISEKIKIVNNTVVSDKNDFHHGYGLQNIKSALAEYDSHMTIECDDSRFILSFIIYF